MDLQWNPIVRQLDQEREGPEKRFLHQKSRWEIENSGQLRLATAESDWFQFGNLGNVGIPPLPLVYWNLHVKWELSNKILWLNDLGAKY